MIARPIVPDGTNDGRAQPADIIFQNLESFTVAVAGNDDSPVLHKLRQIGRLAAGRRARVEDSFSWLRIEELTRNYCAGVLNVAMTRIESRHWQIVEFYKIWVARKRS
jgi:hypothetical protein